MRISWDEALATVAEKLDDIRQKFGPESVALCLGEPKGLELAFAQRFASAFGTPNITTPGHICHIPTELASMLTYGSSCVADSEQLPRCIMVWGSNLFHTHAGMPLSEFNSALASGAKLIVIDPRRTNSASRADIWIKLRPSSDGALALGMIKVIIEEHLYDGDFVAQWTTGFDRLEEETKTYSLQEVEEITWVSQEQIAEAARLYAQTRPATVQWGNALEHSINSFQTCRAISILRAITGNLDIPGGEVLVAPPPVTRPGRFMLLREFPRQLEKMAGNEFKLAARSAFIPGQSLVKAILEEKPCAVKAALLFGTNPLLSYPNANETCQALRKLEFLVVADFFMTPTAMLADLVLPSAANGEFDEIAPYPASSGAILAYSKVADPPGECWSDMRMINELARRLGLEKHFWSDESQALDYILEPSGLSFEEFKNQRYLEGNKGYRKHEAKGFRTPSGKVEIRSKQLEEFGYSTLPLYRELSQIAFDSAELVAEYPLLLTNAKERSFCHSAYRNIPSLRGIAPEPVVELSPETARRFGLREGDWIGIETRVGRIRQKLSLDNSLDPRIVFASFGWWFPEKDASTLCDWDKSNINILTESAPPHEPGLGSLTLRGVPCRVFKDETAQD